MVLSIIFYGIIVILLISFFWTHSNKHIKNDRCKSKINRLMKERIKCVGHISRMIEMQKTYNLVGNTKLKTTDRCL